MKLLQPELLIKTGDVDHADWNYRPVLGWLQRSRFQLVKSLLHGVQCYRLLEVGYGSGIFMPELVHFCRELYGIDIHDKAEKVQAVLAGEGIQTQLCSSSIESTNFPNHYFDYVIAVSALEFVDNANAAAREIQRILKPEGFLIVVTPGHSKILDIGLKLFTGESAKRDYENRRELLLTALLGNYSISETLIIPPVIGRFIPLYTCLKLRPLQTRFSS